MWFSDRYCYGKWLCRWWCEFYSAHYSLTSCLLLLSITEHIEWCYYLLAVNRMPNQMKIGGTPHPQWRTLYECERECHYDATCTGYDWNKDPTTRDRDRCLFHYEDHGGCESRIENPMVDHYEPNDYRCCKYHRFSSSKNKGVAIIEQRRVTLFDLLKLRKSHLFFSKKACTLL